MKQLQIILVLLLCTAFTAHGEESKRCVVIDYVAMTRDASAIVIGPVLRQGGAVVVSVQQVCKGANVPRTIPVPERYLLPGKKRIWVFFLKGTGTFTVKHAVQTGPSFGWMKQRVTDILHLDGLPAAEGKFRYLVTMACRKGNGTWVYYSELDRLNTAAHLKLLAPLAETDSQLYLRMLASNPNPKATDLLLPYLDAEEPQVLLQAIEALCYKNRNDTALSQRLEPFLQHASASIRKAACFALQYRDHYDAYPLILKLLDDLSTEVRLAALSWPWYAHARTDPHIRAKLRQLAAREEGDLHKKACRQLVSIRDMGSFYFLWWVVMTRPGGPDLSLLLEHSPVTLLLLAFWPTLAAVLFFVLSPARHDRRCSFFRGTAFVLLLWGIGAGIGLLLGVCRGTGSVTMHVLILTPAIVMPAGLIGAAIRRWIAVRQV